MRRFFLVVAVLPLAVAARPEQQAAKDWLSIKEWWGTFEVVATSEGSLREGQGDEFTTNEWKETETSYFSFHLNHRSRSPHVFRRGALPAVAELTEKERWQAWSSIHPLVEYSVDGEAESKVVAQDTGEAKSIIRTERESRKTRTGGGTDRGCRFALQVDIKNAKYALSAQVNRLIRSSHVKWHGTWRSLHTQEPSGIRDEESGDESSGGSIIRGQPKDAPDGEVDDTEFKAFNQPLPSDPKELAGSMTFPMELPPGRTGKGQVKQQIVVSWKFTMTPPPSIELELEAEGDGAPLANWRPKGGPDESTPGSFVTLTATVVSRGGPLPDKPVYMAIRLTQSSREKGICMNFPENASDRPEHDFKFRDQENGKNCLGERTVRVMDPKGVELKATLACFDYGAWGEVTATARLESGRRLVAHVKGKPSERKLLLPERKPASLIATSWKAAGSDTSDEDNDPVGDGQKGDGLTTYEEYRGFMVSGAWTDTDPAKKDFFIRNEAGGVADPGIKLFKALSDLEVRLLAAGELHKDRVVNRNRTEGPNVVDQHGIKIVYRPAVKGYCQAVSSRGMPSLPKDIEHVLLGQMPPNMVNADTGGGAMKSMPYAGPTVAHELFHCCNVWHHGEELPSFAEDQEWVKDGSDVKERGVKITVVDEGGANIESILSWEGLLRKTKVVAVHTMHGTSSGDTGCVMRYDTARAFIVPVAGNAIPDERRMLKFGDEVVGGGLCTSGAATGTNLPRGSLPGRFGAAAHNRGNCKGQIVVNDRATATTRK